MNRSRLLTLASLSSLVLTAALGACKLDVDPLAEVKNARSIPADGGAAADAEPLPDGGASSTDSDGGAPTNDAAAPTKAAWAAAPGGERIPLNSAGDEKCSFELAYLVENPQVEEDALYTITLEKKDASPGSCVEPKGFVTLASHSYALPAGAVRRHATDQLIAVAWNQKATPEVEAQSVMHLAQIDWATGADLHDAQMFVKGTPEAVPAQPLVPTSMNLSVGFDVILQGTGEFPGATGEGQSFEATWVGFLSTKPQAPSAADSAAQQ